MYRLDRRGVGSESAAEAWNQRIGAFARLPALIRQLGADPDAILASLGLAGDALDGPERRIPYALLGPLLRTSAERTACAHFGLLAGRMWHVGDLGALGEIMRNCATVRDALQTLTVHQHLNSQGGLAFLIERGGMVDLGYAIYHPCATHTNEIYDSALAAGYNYLRELCGGDWVPSEVLLAYAKPADATHYRSLFRTLPRFNSEFCALRFPAHWMERRIPGADAERRRSAEARVEAAGDADLLHDTFRVLRLLLLHGRNSGNDAAQALSLHRRTLNRRLKRQGTTFQRVLDEVRFSVARQLLGMSDIALDDVAATLGYAGVSPFMRTFHRWAGTTPGRWRRVAASRLPHAVGVHFDSGPQRRFVARPATRIPHAGIEPGP